jgi:hypothetical protein
MAYIEIQTATIANGASLSAEVALGEKTLVGIVMPAAWDAAGLTFQASQDDVTFSELQDGSGAAISFTVSAGIFVAVDPTRWRGITGIKVRSGTSGAPVNQTAQRTIQLITRTIY